MGKILSLDLGDQWVGIAISDKIKFFAKPLTTVTHDQISDYLVNFVKDEDIEKIIIGYPRTMKGTESEQTKKVVAEKEKLENILPHIPFGFWDERLSSKRAQTAKPAKTKDDKLKSHSIAAAFILDSYLTFLKNQNSD